MFQTHNRAIRPAFGAVWLYIFYITFYVVFMPGLLIWAINTLFSLNIELTIKTWFAVLVIILLVPAKPKFELSFRTKD